MARGRDFDGMRRRRMQAARLFEQGASQAEVARRLRVSRQSAMVWERAFRKGGRLELEGAHRAGRRPRLSAAQLRSVEKALLRGPEAAGYRTALWTLSRIAALIEKTTGVRYHPGHVWRILHQLGWSRQKPTTRARERDEATIERWVRERWPRVKKTPRAAAP